MDDQDNKTGSGVQSPAPVAGDEPARPASEQPDHSGDATEMIEQPVEAIGAGREELLPCPFCGGSNIEDRTCHHARDPSGDFDMIGCTECGAGIIDGSVAAWNRRAALSPASPARTPMGGEVEALREEDVARAVMDAIPTIKGGWASAYKIASRVVALAASSPSPAQGGSDYTTLADLHTIKGWLHGLSTHPDLEDVVADGGVTAGMVYQQEAREFAGRIGRILAAPPSLQPVEGK